MELEVKDNKFYVLVNKSEKSRGQWLYNTLSDSVKKLRDFLKAKVSTENVELMSVELKRDKFEITTVPWSTIATELVKE